MTQEKKITYRAPFATQAGDGIVVSHSLTTTPAGDTIIGTGIGGDAPIAQPVRVALIALARQAGATGRVFFQTAVGTFITEAGAIATSLPTVPLASPEAAL